MVGAFNLKHFGGRQDTQKCHTSIVDFPQPYSEISAIGLTRFSNYVLARETGMEIVKNVSVRN